MVAAATGAGVLLGARDGAARRRRRDTGLHQGLAFALVNLAWAAGQGTGAAAGGSLAKATADAVPFAVVAALCLTTLGALGRRRTGAASPA